MRVYKLDLESLLPLLAEFQQNGSLSTVLPPSALKQRGPCKVRIDLLQGQVVYCHIEDSTRQIYVLDNSKIANTLYGLGELDWRLDEGVNKLYSSRVDPYQTQPLPRLDSSSGQYPSMPASPPTQYSPMFQTAQRQSVSSLVPRVIATPDASILNSLSRNQRRVLVLVDGTRNIKKITEILFSSSHDLRIVLQVLRELENMGLVIISG